MAKRGHFLLLILLFFYLAACSTTNSPSEMYKGQTPQEIFAEGKKSLKEGNYADASKHFEALDVQYPFKNETTQAQLYLIYAYYMKEDYALAVAAADRYIRLHPTDPHVDYAFYMRGLANYQQSLGVLERMFSVDLADRELTPIKKAYTNFNELITTFPQSRYAASAHQHMIYLRNILARHQLKVAQYYYDHKAYVAAADRAASVVAHYQGAPSVVPALQLMANSYHQLGMTKMEAETRKVMTANGYTANNT